MDLKTDTRHNLPDKFEMESQAFDMEELIADFAKGEKSLNVLLPANEGDTTDRCSEYIKAKDKPLNKSAWDESHQAASPSK